MMKGLEKAKTLGPEGIINELLKAGLRDRDYENLSVGKRLSENQKRLVCQCSEMESGLSIYEFLLANQGNLIWEGALIAAIASGAENVEFYFSGNGEMEILKKICLETPAPEVNFDFIPQPFKENLKGYEEVSTLVINGETLIHIAEILRNGADWYRLSGTENCPGTKLFQVRGCVNKEGIFEISLGTSLRKFLDETCHGIPENETLKAVIVGGGKGSCYKEDELDISLDFDSIRDSGGLIGSGIILVLGQNDCIIDVVKQGISESCYELCGKCSLGREGSYQLREAILDMTRGRSKSNDIDMIVEIGQTMQIGCACIKGKTAPNLILSGLKKFPEDYEAHMKRKLCKALVCQAYVTFHILPELCNGCGACLEECPEEAIAGGRNKIHVIDQDLCEKCGRCYEVCQAKEKAVVKAGALKPRTPKKPIPIGSFNS